jgi:hypothetical protein
LINDSLLTWAQFLREEAVKRNYIIVDNTNLTQEKCFEEVEREIDYL